MKRSFEHSSDEELISGYRENGSGEILAELFRRYQHLVFGVCMKYFRDRDLAKDATMQIFEKLITDLQKHEIHFFNGWIYRVSQNYCFMELRKRKFHSDQIDSIPEDFVEYDGELHPAQRKEEMLNLMEKELNELNTEQRTCIELFYLKKQSYQEIMEQTGFTFMQVKSHIQNGKRNLKIKLERHHD